ncbi:unnamed protein product [Symbiodinium sp. CCMP2592]|nr:unnamed protein product [Symbiodinium sp. CCMP2592]
MEPAQSAKGICPRQAMLSDCKDSHNFSLHAACRRIPASYLSQVAFLTRIQRQILYPCGMGRLPMHVPSARCLGGRSAGPQSRSDFVPSGRQLSTASVATAVARISARGRAKQPPLVRKRCSTGCLDGPVESCIPCSPKPLELQGCEATAATSLVFGAVCEFLFQEQDVVLAGCSLPNRPPRKDMRLRPFDAIHCVCQNKHRISGIYMGIWGPSQRN